MLSGADPGFPVGGGADPRGAPTYDFVKFSEKMHELEKIFRHWLLYKIQNFKMRVGRKRK